MRALPLSSTQASTHSPLTVRQSSSGLPSCSAAGIKAAIRHGARSIEHAVYLDDEAIDLMLQHGTWLVPTLVAPLAVIERATEGARDISCGRSIG